MGTVGPRHRFLRTRSASCSRTRRSARLDGAARPRDRSGGSRSPTFAIRRWRADGARSVGDGRAPKTFDDVLLRGRETSWSRRRRRAQGPPRRMQTRRWLSPSMASTTWRSEIAAAGLVRRYLATPADRCIDPQAGRTRSAAIARRGPAGIRWSSAISRTLRRSPGVARANARTARTA